MWPRSTFHQYIYRSSFILDQQHLIYSNLYFQIAEHYPMAVVDMYCNHEFAQSEVDQTVADAAFPRAEELLKVSICCIIYTRLISVLGVAIKDYVQYI